MPGGIVLKLDGDGCWTDLNEDDRTIHHLANGSPPVEIATLRGGMSSGAPSVAIRIDIGAKETVIVETSMAMFLAAAQAVRSWFENQVKEN